MIQKQKGIRYLGDLRVCEAGADRARKKWQKMGLKRLIGRAR